MNPLRPLDQTPPSLLPPGGEGALSSTSQDALDHVIQRTALPAITGEEQLPEESASLQVLFNPELSSIILSNLEPPDAIPAALVCASWRNHIIDLYFHQQKQLFVQAIEFLRNQLQVIDSSREGGSPSSIRSAHERANSAIRSLDQMSSLLESSAFPTFQTIRSLFVQPIVEQLITCLKELLEIDLEALHVSFKHVPKPKPLLNIVKVSLAVKQVETALLTANPDLFDWHSFMKEPLSFIAQYDWKRALHLVTLIPNPTVHFPFLRDILLEGGKEQGHYIQACHEWIQLSSVHPEYGMEEPLGLAISEMVQARECFSQYTKELPSFLALGRGNEQYRKIFHLSLYLGKPQEALEAIKGAHEPDLLEVFAKQMIAQGSCTEIIKLGKEKQCRDHEQYASNMLFYSLGMRFAELGFFQKAQEMASCCSLEIFQRRTHNHIVLHLNEFGNLEESEKLLTAVSTTPGKYDLSWNLVSIGYREQGRLDKAFQAAMKLKNTLIQTELFQSICQAHLQRKQYDDAATVARHILTQSVQASTLQQIVVGLMTQDQDEEALVMANSISLPSFHDITLANLVEEFLALENLEKAEEAARFIHQEPARSVAPAKILLRLFPHSMKKCQELLDLIHQDQLPEEIRREISPILQFMERQKRR